MKLRDDSRLKAYPAVKDGFVISPVRAGDCAYWRKVLGFSKLEFGGMMLGCSGYTLRSGGEYAGLMYHSMLWGSAPLLNMVYVEKRFRGNGAWRFMMDYWDENMRSRGCAAVLVCIPSDMTQQKFYRERGYTDCGMINLKKDVPSDIFLMKKL